MAKNSESHNGKQRFKKVGPNLYRDAAGRYYLLVKRGGKQFRRSLKTTDSELAKRRLRKFQDEAGRLSTDGTSSIRFDQVAERWLAAKRPDLKASSAGRRATALKALAPYFNGRLVRAIGPQQIETWKINRAPTISPRTWNIEVETLKQIFAYAKDTLRIVLDNPVEGLKRKKQPKTGIVIPSKEQFRALVSELRSGHRATGEAADLVEFLAYSGCRVAEARGVRWQDINEDLGSILITGGEIGTKNHEARVVPLFAPLARLVQTMRARKPFDSNEAALFRIGSATLQIVRACRRLGLPRFGHHTMRHFFASNAIEAGCDFKVIAGWVGHKDGGVLVAMTYGHLRHEHSAAMAKRIVFDAMQIEAGETNIVPILGK